MTRRSQRFRHSHDRRPAAIVVAVQEAHQTPHQVATSALELSRLARVLGIEVVRTVVQSRASASPAALLSLGRLRQLAVLTGGPGPRPRDSRDPPLTPLAPDEQADLVLIDAPISAGQQHAIEQATGVEVLDRTAIILRVFEQRARSREAKLQVELARCLYRAPRIRDDVGDSDREGGGGRGGRGHSNVELRKQQNRERIATLRRELEALPARAAVRRQLRDAMPQVALVGYTNAGKSSWMRALTGSGVHVDDALFATVDATVRTLMPETTPKVLISDTVGFIANLPHELVASFRATLDEARHADLLLVVGDASDPDLSAQLHVTRETLANIGAGDIPWQLVLNKVDRLGEGARALLASIYPDAWLLSAHDERDVSTLRERVAQHFEQTLVEGTIFVPYARSELLGQIHRRARVLTQHCTAHGTRLRVRADSDAWSRWRSALPQA